MEGEDKCVRTDTQSVFMSNVSQHLISGVFRLGGQHVSGRADKRIDEQVPCRDLRQAYACSHVRSLVGLAPL